MINSIFEQIGADAGRNYKLDVMQSYSNNDTLKRVCFLALDPFTQYFIRKIPAYTPSSRANAKSLEWALKQLDKLSSREATGHAGIAHLKMILKSVTAADALVIERVISKDLKCGMSEGTVNKTWPGLIHEFPCMLASAYDQKLIDKIVFPAYAQLKQDGMRFAAIVCNRAVEFRSRNGKEIQIPDDQLANAFLVMAAGADVVFDGELLVTGPDDETLDRKTGNGILNKAVKGTMPVAQATQVRASVWDRIPLAAFKLGVDKTPYETRLATLMFDVARIRFNPDLGHMISIVPSELVKSIDDARAMFNKYLAQGLEGIILKTRSMPWENKRSKHQIKFKAELDCTMRVIGWEEGSGKHTGRMGALVCASEDGLVKTNVGTGFSDIDRITMTREACIGRLVDLKYNARITDKRSYIDSLFLPVMVEFDRTDKSVADYSKDIK